MTVIGTWNILVSTPMGDQKLLLDIADGTPPIGSITSDVETNDLYDITVDGDHLTATNDVSVPFAMVVKLDVTADGDTISGKAVSGPFPPAPVKGTRA